MATPGLLGIGFLGATASAMVTSNSSEKKFLGAVTVTNTSDTTKQEVYFWLETTATTLTTTKPGGNFMKVFTLQPLQTKSFSLDPKQHFVDQSYSFSGKAEDASTVRYWVSGTTE